MKVRKYFRNLVFMGFAAQQLLSPAVAGAATAIAEVRATILPSLSVSAVKPLDFGYLESGASPSHVVVAANGISRSMAGDGKLRNGRNVSAAVFEVSGEPNASVSVSFSKAINLVSASGHTMSVDNFMSPDKYAAIGSNGRKTIRVGGTLSMSANQPVGDYSGALNITINYN